MITHPSSGTHQPLSPYIHVYEYTYHASYKSDGPDGVDTRKTRKQYIADCECLRTNVSGINGRRTDFTHHRINPVTVARQMLLITIETNTRPCYQGPVT